jgi:hypothetical protein
MLSNFNAVSMTERYIALIYYDSLNIRKKLVPL